MRKVRFSAAVSIDGYLAGPNGEIDWIARDPDFDFGELFSQFDTALVGRNTYEEMKAKKAGLPGIDLFVISTTLKSEQCADAKVRSDPSGAIREIRAIPGKDIWLFGGASLLASIARLELVDTIELSVSPVILGAGLKLMSLAEAPLKLELISERVYPKTGMVRLDYAVNR